MKCKLYHVSSLLKPSNAFSVQRYRQNLCDDLPVSCYFLFSLTTLLLAHSIPTAAHSVPAFLDTSTCALSAQNTPQWTHALPVAPSLPHLPHPLLLCFFYGTVTTTDELVCLLSESSHQENPIFLFCSPLISQHIRHGEGASDSGKPRMTGTSDLKGIGK